jgi:hypothetical protein
MEPMDEGAPRRWGKGVDDLEARLAFPHPDRLSPHRADYDAVIALHGQAMGAGRAGYLDPATGSFVFTARTLFEQGECCASGCRHCPWVRRPADPPTPGGEAR